MVDGRYIRQMLPPGLPKGVIPAEEFRFWNEWRKSAGDFAVKVAGNKDIQKRVGVPMDSNGAMCLLWTGVYRAAEDTHKALQARYTKLGRNGPAWTQTAMKETKRRAEEACNNRGGPNPDAPRRVENLGVLYLAEHDKLDEDETLREDTTEIFSGLAKFLAQVEVLVPAAMSGGLAPATIPLPIIDPSLFMPKPDRDYSL